MLPHRLLCLALVAAALAACSALDQALAGIDKPSVRLVGASLEDLDLQKIRLATVVEIQNPYAVDLPVPSLDYALTTGGVAFLNGARDIGVTIPAKGKTEVALPIDIGFEGLLRVVEGLRPGRSIPYETEIGVNVDAPAMGRLRLPLRHVSTLPIPAAPDVKLASLAWKNLSLSGARMEMLLDVGNPNDFDLSLDALAFGLKVAGEDIVTTSAAQYAEMPSGGRSQIPIAIDARFDRMGLSLLQMLSGRGAETSLNGTMDLMTPYGKLLSPFSTSGFTPFR